jgi:hypothetical protein
MLERYEPSGSGQGGGIERVSAIGTTAHGTRFNDVAELTQEDVRIPEEALCRRWKAMLGAVAQLTAQSPECKSVGPPLCLQAASL